MLRDEAVLHQTIHPTLSEDAFILRVLLEESLVEEHTLKELKGRCVPSRADPWWGIRADGFA